MEDVIFTVKLEVYTKFTRKETASIIREIFQEAIDKEHDHDCRIEVGILEVLENQDD